MNILWFTNIAVPVVAQHINKGVAFGGGWLTGTIESLKECSEIKLSIAFPIGKSEKLISGEIENICYFGIPVDKNMVKYDVKMQEYYNHIVKKTTPDCIHIWGTEYLHSYYAMRACQEAELTDHVVVSIQGMVSVYAKHYLQGVPESVVRRKTISDFRYHTGMLEGKKRFEKRGVYEEKTLKLAKYVIGRTDWDKACTYLINPDAEYLFCNETLRSLFYKKRWNIDKIERHSIFVSQAGYSVKGFHYMLEALEILQKFYPDVKLYTTGNVEDKTVQGRLHMSSYTKYIVDLIKKKNLKDKVFFVGNLNEKKICERYLNSHVFVSPSLIENSPNSVGEAMLLGMPVVTSDVGGVKNLIMHEKEGFIYQTDAPYMMAYYIIKIFESDKLAKSIGEAAHLHAKKTHSAEINHKRLLEIYRYVAR